MLENKYLKFVDYRNFYIWEVSKNLSHEKKLSKFNYIKLEQLLKQAKRIITLTNETEYKLLGIHSYGMGVFHRGIKKGSEIQAKNLYQTKYDDFIYSRLGASSGSFGIITKDFNNYFVSNEFPIFEINIDKINIIYLNIVLTLETFYKQIAKMNTGSALKRFHEANFLNLQIPLPSLEIQQQLVNAYNQKINLAKELEEEAENLEKNIDSYLFDKLGIESIVNLNKIKVLCFIKYQDLNEWGVEFNLGTKNSNNILKSRIYQNEALKNLVEINPSTNLNINNLKEVSFLPMECISDIYGEIKNQYSGDPIKAKGYTKFKEGDLIWAKITPCMENGKSAIAKNLLNGYGYGSTEFHVLRKKDKNISIEYIYYLLRTKTLRQEAKSSFTGSAGQQRVGKSFLENLIIPVPSLEIQNEIVTYLSQQKDKIKQLKNQALEKCYIY